MVSPRLAVPSSGPIPLQPWYPVIQAAKYLLAVPSSGPIPLQRTTHARSPKPSHNSLAVPSSGPIPLQPLSGSVEVGRDAALQYPLAGLFLYNTAARRHQPRLAALQYPLAGLFLYNLVGIREVLVRENLAVPSSGPIPLQPALRGRVPT